MKLDPVFRRFFDNASALHLTQREKADMRAALQAHMQLATGDIHLSTGELAEGKDALMSYMRAHPVQDPSSFTFFTRVHSFFFSRLPALAFSALLVVVGSGAVVASAAEGALPGDALYVVKVDVLEPLRGRMIRTPEKRMAWKVRKVERRLSEAKALQRRDRLTESHRASIERSIEQEVAELQDDALWSDQEMVIASQQVLEETMDAASFGDDDIAEHREWRALKSFVRARRSEVHRSMRQRMETAYDNLDDVAAPAAGLVSESAVMLAPEPAAPTLMAVPVSAEPQDPVEAPVMMMRAKEVSSEEGHIVDKEGSREKKMKKEENGASKAVQREREDERNEDEARPESPPQPEPSQDIISDEANDFRKKGHEDGMERLKEKREHIQKELRGLRKKGELQY